MAMPMTERARLGLASRLRRRAVRQEALTAAIGEGVCLKRAAFEAGISERTARRYRAEAR